MIDSISLAMDSTIETLQERADPANSGLAVLASGNEVEGFEVWWRVPGSGPLDRWTVGFTCLGSSEVATFKARLNCAIVQVHSEASMARLNRTENPLRICVPMTACAPDTYRSPRRQPKLHARVLLAMLV